jgi:cytochrome P450
MLCIHTDVQQKLHAELDSYEAAATRDFNADDMIQLVYMQACMRETLRHYPPAAQVARSATRPVILPSGLQVDQNVLCILDIYALHHSKSIWGDDAMEWKPSRWLTSDGKSLTDHPHVSTKYPLSHVFLPFIAGAHNCAGQNLSRLEAALTVATLLKKYEFRLDTDHKVEIKQEATMMFPNGLYVYATERTKR